MENSPNLDDILRRIGWSKTELARRMGVSQKTVWSWKESVPAPVWAYLELVDRLIGKD